jgi:hypothetical protein
MPNDESVFPVPERFARCDCATIDLPTAPGAAVAAG